MTNWFKCPICGEEFETQEKLKGHYVSIHNHKVSNWM